MTKTSAAYDVCMIVADQLDTVVLPLQQLFISLRVLVVLSSHSGLNIRREGIYWCRVGVSKFYN